MADYDVNRLEIAQQVKRTIASEDELTPIQARSFVRSLQTAWRVPLIRWDDSESRNQLYDARRLIYSAQIFEKLDGDKSPNAIACFRRAGELLEWLSRSNDSLRTFAPLDLLAAASYQLGGLPAMSSALISQLDIQEQGALLYANFFKGNFDGVLEQTVKFWEANLDMTLPDSSLRLLQGNSEDSTMWYFTVELVRCLGLISDALRRGSDNRFERALEKLKSLEEFGVRTLSEDMSLLLTLLYSVSIRFKEASIYVPIRRLANINTSYSSQLEMFARGQFHRGRGVLWSSQQRGLDRLLEDSSFALCTPTGSGKTLVANLALVKELLLRQEDEIAPLGLYIVPSRALAGEVEAKLTDELGSDFIVTGLYGGADWGITDYWLDADKPTVLIATVEKADALVRYLGPLLFNRLRLLVVDEAHQVVCEDSIAEKKYFAEHASRSLRLESFVSRVLTHSPNVVRIALTAVAGGAAQPVSNWIEGGQDAYPEGLNYRSTRQVIGSMEVLPGRPTRILLDLINGQPLYVRGREEAVYLNLQIPAMPQLPASMRNSIYRFNELQILWTALHLVEGKRRILISVMQQPEKTMRWFKEAIDLASWQGVNKFEMPENSHQRAQYEEARQACIDYCGIESFELALLNQGIATNHGQMPQRLRRLMTRLIEARICPITVATATLTEGVNLPFDLIFLSSLKRSTYNHEQQINIDNHISTAEFRNLAGRAGRPGASSGMEGMTLVSIPQHPSTTAESSKPKQRNQINGLKADYEYLLDRLISDEHNLSVNSPLSLLIETIRNHAEISLGIIDEEEFLDWIEEISPLDISDMVGRCVDSNEAQFADSIDELDGVLLTALVELDEFNDASLSNLETEEFLTNLWRRTFSYVAMSQERLLERVFIHRGKAVVETLYPDSDEREKLYQYGFSPVVGRRFDEIGGAIIEELLTSGDYGGWEPADRLKLFGNIGAFIEDDRGYGFRVKGTVTEQRLLANWTDVLSWWMNVPNSPKPQPDKLRAWQRFVSDNLEFRLGTAIGAVISQAWTEGSESLLEVPTLEKWKSTTGLPWFGFWAKELLRWGTLEPFVAFSLSRGMSKTRHEAEELRQVFLEWLYQSKEDVTNEDLIDPQLYLSWQRSLPQNESQVSQLSDISVAITGTNGSRINYDVIPLKVGGQTFWIDAAGYELARSNGNIGFNNGNIFKFDYNLNVADKSVSFTSL